jgi:2-methylaconitate cis-trans-isomerase PrpF
VALMSQRAIPCLFMRGGTSRGPYFLGRDLPADVEVRDRVLLAAMGSPDLRQIDGLGGADTLTSKVAIVSPSSRDGIDVDYLFAQVSIDQVFVDTAPSCGNMLAGIGPFAIERGVVAATPGTTRVRIFNVNTASRIDAIVQTPDGSVEYEGSQTIDGVPGSAAPIFLNFSEIVGSKCGALFPTGSMRERIDGVDVTCIDVAMPMVMLAAVDLGITGYETTELGANAALLARIEAIRLEAGRRMGLGDVSKLVVPKVALLAKPRAGGVVSSRYLTPHRLHAAHAVTGGICVGTCAMLEGTVGDPLADRGAAHDDIVRLEHPSGTLDVRLEVRRGEHGPDVVSAGVVRTARKILDGAVFVPARIWS